MKAALKNDIRHLRDTFGRFAAILAIVALGVAFYAGIKVTAPDMRATGEKYFDSGRFMDVRLLSTIGFNADDIEAVKAATGVKQVAPAYSLDALVRLNGQNHVVKLHSVDTTAGGGINLPLLTEGRLPARPDECLADPRLVKATGLKIGDAVSFTDGNGDALDDSLASSTFTVVGVAEYPVYISYERGSSTIGGGAADAYFLLPQAAFDLEVYTDLYLTVDNPAGDSRFGDAYQDLVKPVTKALEAVGDSRAAIRYREIKAEGEQKLADARKELTDGEQKLAVAEDELRKARADIADGEQKLQQAEKDFDKQIKDAQKELDRGNAEYRSGLSKWKKQQSALASSRAEYEKGRAALEAAKAQMGLDGATIDDMQSMIAQLSAQLALLPPDSPEYAAALEKLQGLQTIVATQQSLDKAQKQIEDGERQLASAKRTLDSAKRKLDSGLKTLSSSKAEGRRKLDDERKKLDDAERQLADGEEDYRKQKNDAEPKLEQARQDITDGQKQLDELKMPQWYVLDNSANAGFESFKQDAERIAAIGEVFPLIFFLVAALVSLTTMTRLVEDERTYIGTLKALGYGRVRIAMKYLLYAVAASLCGSIVGLLVGMNVLPRVVFDAYRILYSLPPVEITFNLYYAVTSTAAAVACATVPAFLVCYESLRTSPASLMRPKAPPSGKRILLERIPALWRAISFNGKVTARNLFRYKKRFLMTAVGVAGCTALLFTGFGLMDSISDIVGKQYGEIRTYDLQVGLKDSVSAADGAELTKVLDRAGARSVLLRQQSIDAVFGTAVKSVSLVVPCAGEDIAPFVHLRERVGGKALRLSDDSVIITEKLSILYSLKVGDKILLRDGDGPEQTVTIGGIAENYVLHYIYMSPVLYEKLFQKPVVANQALCRADGAALTELPEKLMDLSAVSSVTQTAKLEENFGNMIGAMKYVVLVLIVSAALLAFVVLVSLTNINIDERLRELATIKVLGFYDSEVSSYVYRESIALTVIGTAAGLVLGFFLERFVTQTAEVDLVMFSRTVSWTSYVYSALLTFVFSALVNAAMVFRLKGIEMVSTLKGVE